jgi:cobalt-zinc-cadmium efflux system membrane fusion protein
MKLKIALLIIIVSLITGVITYTVTKSRLNAKSASTSHHDKEEEADKHGEGESENLRIAGIKTIQVTSGKGKETITITGKITIPSDKMVKVCPRIDGKIVLVKGIVGQTVNRGQVLAVLSSIDLAEARARYRKALATLRASQVNYEQESQIAKLGSNSLRKFEEARSEVLNAQGSFAEAKNEITRTRSEMEQCLSRLHRARELYKDQIISKQDLDTAETEYKKDQANAEQAKETYRKFKARLDIAKQYLEREEKLYKNKVLDIRALQSVKTEVTNASIEVQAAADKIRVLGADPEGTGETINIVSPISGRIVTRNANIGEIANPSNVLFTIINPSNVWVEADVYEKDIAKAHKGQTVEIRVDAYPEKTFMGHVDYVGDILSSDSRTAKIRCIVDNHKEILKGEMFTSVSLVTGERDDVILIPKEAVLDDSGKKVVFTPCMDCPEDKKAGKSICGSYDMIEVKTGSIQGNQIEILNGLQSGDLVVIVGQYQLKSALGSGKLEAGCTDGHGH